MTAPLVTIGIPVWNGATFVGSAIEALRSQTHANLEILISDNGSTDATEQICRAAAASDPRIRYLRERENRGAAWNYNRLVHEARGTFFSWAAADDVREPTHTARCVEAFSGAPADVVLVYPRANFVDDAGGMIGPDTDCMATMSSDPHMRLARVLRTVNMANPVFGLIRMKALRQTRLIGGFTASDYVLLAELAMLGKFVEVPDVLFARRIHRGSSREANRTRATVTAWFDPGSAPPRLLSDRQRLLVEYLRSVRRLPLSPGDRAKCLAIVPAVMGYRRARVVGGRWKSAVNARLAER